MKHKNEVAYNPFRDIIAPNEMKKQNILYPYKSPNTMLEASVVHRGNIARMQKILNKAQRGEKVHIVTLGGSITEGSGRSEGAYYGDVLYKWFKRRFHNENIVYTNIGRGTTTSLFGCARVERDIAPLEPDFIVVEYAVNDTILPAHIAKECFEALVRKLLSLPCAPCVFLLFTCLDTLASSQPLDVPIGLYYDLPMASLGDALRYHVRGKQNLPENYIKEHFIYDGVHPNTYGYSLLCDFITFQLEEAMNSSIEEQMPVLPAEPLVSNRFIDAHIQDSGFLKVISNCFWEPDDKEVPYRQRGFCPQKVGAEICFSFSNCQFLSMVYRKSISPRAGIVQVQIDENEPFTVDSYFYNGWGTYNDYMIILDTCEKREHTVRITFTGKKSEQALEKASCLQISPEEVGSKFTLVEFLSA